MAAEDGRASRMELSAGAPSDFFCPISHEMMVRPVVCSDGHSYERAEIARWLQQHNTSPRTGLTLPNLTLTPNITLRNAIEDWRVKTFRLIRPADLTIGEQIGRGTFNRVYAAKLVVRREGAPPRTIDVAASIRVHADIGATEEEIKTLVKLSAHPNLVKYIGLIEPYAGNPAIIITELAPKGSVSDFMETQHLSSEHQQIMLRQIASGMQALSDAKFVHRDLAARNVLVFHFNSSDASKLVVKICDFGLSKRIAYQATHATVGGDVVPYRWMPPEAIRQRRFSEASDVWAFGVTAWEILTGGDLPYWEIDDEATVKRGVVAGTLRLTRPTGDHVSDPLWELVESCFRYEKADRPTFAELLARLPAPAAAPHFSMEGPLSLKKNATSDFWFGAAAEKEIDYIMAVASFETFQAWKDCAKASMPHNTDLLATAPPALQLPPPPSGTVLGVRVEGGIAKLMGAYLLNLQHSPKSDATHVYTHMQNKDLHLFRDVSDGWWYINSTKRMLSTDPLLATDSLGCKKGALIASATTSSFRQHGPSPLGLPWKEATMFWWWQRNTKLTVTELSAEDIHNERLRRGGARMSTTIGASAGVVESLFAALPTPMLEGTRSADPWLLVQPPPPELEIQVAGRGRPGIADGDILLGEDGTHDTEAGNVAVVAIAEARLSTPGSVVAAAAPGGAFEG